MSDTEAAGLKFYKAVKSVSDFTISLSVFGLLISLSHDIGYFNVIGNKYFYTLGTVDFLKGALTTVPNLLTFCVSFPIILTAILSDDPIVLDNDMLKNFLEKPTDELVAIMGVLISMYMLSFFIGTFFSNFNTTLYMSFIMTFWIIGLPIITSFIALAVKGHTYKHEILFISIFTLCILFSWLSGIVNAYYSLEDNRNVVSITNTKSNLSSDLQNKLVFLLKISEKGVLVRDLDRIRFVPWDDVKSISSTAPEDKVGFYSKMYEYIIGKPEPSP